MNRLAIVGGLNKGVTDVYWDVAHAEAEKEYGAGTWAPLVIHCFNASRLTQHLRANDWKGVLHDLLDEGGAAKLAGAKGLVIGGSALSFLTPILRDRLKMPVVDLPFALAEKLRSFDFRCAGFLGIRSRREQEMFVNELKGCRVLVPEPEDAQWLTDCADDLLSGKPVAPTWPIRSHRILSDLSRRGAQCVVVADYTLMRWLRPDDSPLLPPFDLSTIHAWAAAMWALQPDFLPAQPCVFAGEFAS